MKRAEALYLRSIVEQAVTSLDDKTASTVPTLFRSMKYDGKLIEAGTRIQWNGKVKVAAVDLWDTEQNNPDNAVTLWAGLPYRDGIRIIPDVIYVTEAFGKDEPGWWGDVVYESLADNNVYTPAQYSDNWKIRE
jgi:hypothetical protein